ncbi:MAG: L-arabinose isomerase [Actinomycetota bacterium]|nr:L-arabinose isomerase [Actinomycetota bacterium]
MTSHSLGSLKIWFVTGSQHLYGPEAVGQVAEHAARIAAELGASLAVPVDIEVRPVQTEADSIRRVMLDANGDDTCLGVIAWMHTFSPAKMWIAGLNALQKPLLHLHTQFHRDLPWATIDMDFMNLNQSAHGDREFGYLETRLGLRRSTVVGHWQDPETHRRVGVWARAAIGRHTGAHLKLARFGDNMRDVAVTEGDKVEAQIRWGVSVNTYPVNELVDAVGEVTDADVDVLVGEYDDTYGMVPELRAGGEKRGSLREAARIELGLRGFLEAGGFDAFTDSFEDLGTLAQLPGIAVQRLMADGFGFGGEGDWKTACLVRVFKAMGEGLPGATSFMEDYTYHLDPFGPLILGAHMLEVCPSLSGAVPRCEIHPLSIGGKADPVRLVFTADPGPGLVAGLIDIGDRMRLVANVIDVVEPLEPLEVLPVAHATWAPAPNLATAAECWLLAGGPHHTALTTALTVEHVEILAEMVGVELVTIDAESSPRRLKQELLWNRAAWTLLG